MDKYVKLRDVPKGKRWEHYWNYYKVHTFIGAFVLIMVGTLISDVAFREKVDVYLTVASTKYIREENTEALNHLLETGGEDFDGNGKTVVDVNQIYMPTDISADPEVVMAAQTRLIAQFQDKNAIIFLIDQDIYDYLYSDEELYANLAETVGGSVTPLLGEDPTRLYLKDIPGVAGNEELEKLPNLFFVMRREQDVNLKNEPKVAEIYQRSVQVMENLASGKHLGE